MFFISLCILMLSIGSNGNLVAIDSNNLATVLNDNEIVFVNFYADWCRFSRMLAPIFQEAAEEAKKVFPEPGKVTLGKVDCDQNSDIAQRYSVNKYPTMKLFRNGQLMKREYRGQRTSGALLEFIKEQLKDPIHIFKTVDEMESLETSKRTIVAYLTSKESVEYQIFERIAKSLKDDCDFYAGIGDISHKERQTGDNIIYKPPNDEPEMVYLGSLTNYDLLKAWATDKCIPLVREITFKNGEELTEEGLPFLILFHKKEDTESLDAYQKVISRNLLDIKSSINFLEADCDTFSHPLQHLGKSPKDCPLIAIDSFKHMYLFPNFADLTVPNKLKDFIKDLHSGKLHREFHHGPDATDATAATVPTTPLTIAPELKEELKKKGMDVEKIEKQAQEHYRKQAEQAATNETPPPPVSTSVKSIFKNLKPSEHRYTILDRLRDEL